MVILSIQWRPLDFRDWSLFMWGGGGDIFCFSMKEKTWLTAHLLSHYTKRLSQLLFYLLLSQFLTCSPPSLQWLPSEYYPLASFSMILQCYQLQRHLTGSSCIVRWCHVIWRSQKKCTLTVSTKLNSVANLSMRRVRDSRGRFGSLQVESNVYRIR